MEDRQDLLLTHLANSVHPMPAATVRAALTTTEAQGSLECPLWRAITVAILSIKKIASLCKPHGIYAEGPNEAQAFKHCGLVVGGMAQLVC